VAEVKLRWTSPALEDLERAHAYIAEERPSAAAEMLFHFERAIATLRRYPQVGRAGRVQGTRELVVARTPFILCYRVKRGNTDIVAIIHSARRWPENF